MTEYAEITLDGCSGEGGGARGLVQAGHYVIGVDINPACRDGYLRSGAHEFICADICEVLADRPFLERFTFGTFHPPCQDYSFMSRCRPELRGRYPRLIRPIQARLDEHWGRRPYTIENVEGARSELRDPVTLCHAPGTPVIDGDWRGLVQDHSSARGLLWRAGHDISICGLPFSEQVSADHRYWVRERHRTLGSAARRRLGTSAWSAGTDREPAWMRASDLQPVIHEIGYPVDMREIPVSAELAGTETAWMLGYAWGNGNLGRRNQVVLSVPDRYPALLKRVTDYARAVGWTGRPQQAPGCTQVTFSHPVLRAALAEFVGTGRAWSQKIPPVWAEHAPLDWQRFLIQGYYDADGNTNTEKECVLGSVSLKGLLVMRRILARLGIPSSIRLARQSSLILGRKVHVQPFYKIRFSQNTAQLGYKTGFKGHYSHPYIDSGCLWSRVENVLPWTGFVCPITTGSEKYLTDFGLSHNCMWMFGRETYRHRLVEAGGGLALRRPFPEPWAWRDSVVTRFGKHCEWPHPVATARAGHWQPGMFVSVAGHERKEPVRQVMEIDWMSSRDAMKEAIPPYMMAWVARQLAVWRAREAAA